MHQEAETSERSKICFFMAFCCIRKRGYLGSLLYRVLFLVRKYIDLIIIVLFTKMETSNQNMSFLGDRFIDPFQGDSFL